LPPPESPPAGGWTRFAATGVFPTLEGLDFLARAITPPGRVRRFDARFFVAEATLIAHRAEGAVHPDAELVELTWIPIEKAREIVKLVKNSKKKAQASIQGDVVRISSKDRDTLQEIIAMVKQQDFGIDLQFTNYRSN